MPIPYVLIDQDDTLCDLAGKVHNIFADAYGLNVPKFEFRNFYDMLNTVPGLTRDVMEDVLHSPGLFSGLEPIPGAVKALHEMEEAGLEMRIVTKPVFRNFTCVPDKKRWVQTHLGDHWLERMVFTEDKTIIMGRYLVDDKPVIKGSNPDPMWKRVVFTQPYNVSAQGLRLTNWEDWRSVLRIPTNVIHIV